MKKYIIIIFCFFFICSCNKDNDIKSINYNSELTYKYKTTVKVHYSTYNTEDYIVYSNNEVYACSFQGTNFLLEKDNSEELLSTTAPIQIIKSEKIENKN